MIRQTNTQSRRLGRRRRRRCSRGWRESCTHQWYVMMMSNKNRPIHGLLMSWIEKGRVWLVPKFGTPLRMLGYLDNSWPSQYSWWLIVTITDTLNNQHRPDVFSVGRCAFGPALVRFLLPLSPHDHRFYRSHRAQSIALPIRKADGAHGWISYSFPPFCFCSEFSTPRIRSLIISFWLPYRKEFVSFPLFPIFYLKEEEKESIIIYFS